MWKRSGETVKWYQKSASQGDADAQALLGVMYAEGKGVSQNNQEAYIWFSLAAVNGDEKYKKARDIVAKKLTSESLAAAQQEATKRGQEIEDRKNNSH